MAKECAALCGLGLCCCGLYLFFNFTIPLYFLITGIVQIDGCPTDYRLPIWMIVYGSFLLADRILDQLFDCVYPKDEQGVSMRPAHIQSLTVGINICEIAMSIIGLIWTAKMLSEGSMSCNGFVFWPSFIFSILAIIGLSASILCIVCVCFGVMAAGNTFTRLRRVSV